MPANQKRKRKRGSDANKTPIKKARKSAENTPKTPKIEKKPNCRKRKLNKKNWRKKKVHRPRSLRFLREKVARSLERALVEAPKIPLIYHLFTERDSLGTPKALLSDVLKQLKISDFVKNTHLLHDTHMLSLTNFTTLFAIERDEPDRRLYLKYWPIYDKQAATVYVDNLPEGCNEEKLMRLANCYGTVAELSISKKNARWIRPRHHPKKKHNNPKNPVHHHIHRIPPKKKALINVGSRPRAFGFVRFVDAESAAKMVAEFRYNDPSLPYQRFDERKREEQRLAEQDLMEFGPGDPENLNPPFVPQELPHQKPFHQNYMIKLINEIRWLRMRRKRRTWPMFMRLKRLRRRLRELRLREFNCLRKAGIVKRNRLISNRKDKYKKRPRRNQQDPSQPSTSSRPRQHAQPATSSARKPGGVRANASIASLLRRRLHNHKNAQRAKLKRKARLEAAARGEGDEKKVEENGEKEDPMVVMETKKKKKRKRKKMSRKLAKYIPGGQVRRFFIQIQVLSMKRYLELKAEYLELIRKEKERMRDEEAALQIPDDIDF